MHSPSLSLLRILRASITSPQRTIRPPPHLRPCFASKISHSCISPNRTISFTVTTQAQQGGNNTNGHEHDSGRNSTSSTGTANAPSYSRQSNPTHRRSELRTADLKPKSRYRGPPPPEDPQTNTSMRTDLGALDIFTDVAPPATSIDACLDDGFHLNSGVKITGGDGCLLVDGEVFSWRPWEAGRKRPMVNSKGQWEVDEEAWGVLSLVWPKPGMLNSSGGAALCKGSKASFIGDFD